MKRILRLRRANFFRDFLRTIGTRNINIFKIFSRSKKKGFKKNVSTSVSWNFEIRVLRDLREEKKNNERSAFLQTKVLTIFKIYSKTSQPKIANLADIFVKERLSTIGDFFEYFFFSFI